jgi:hypothetical protein
LHADFCPQVAQLVGHYWQFQREYVASKSLKNPGVITVMRKNLSERRNGFVVRGWWRRGDITDQILNGNARDFRNDRQLIDSRSSLAIEPIGNRRLTHADGRGKFVLRHV